MKLMLIALMLTSTSAFAHFKIGTYKGVDANNTTCSVEFKKKTFINNIKNPLNENVYLIVNNINMFIATHLPLIDNKLMTIDADKENLTAVKVLKDEVVSLQIHMDHNLGSPAGFTMLKNHLVTKENKKAQCFNLVFQE